MSFSNKKSENIYLDALEYGEKLLIERQPIERKQLREYLESKGYKFETKEEERLRSTLSWEAFSMKDGEPLNRKYYLSIEGYFKLLAYRELSDARKSSKIAIWCAIVAIIISIIAWGTSVYFSNESLVQKTTIEDKQFKVIESILHNLETADPK